MTAWPSNGGDQRLSRYGPCTRQPWGSANVNVEHSAYLHDVSKRATDVNADLGVRVFRGFSVNVGGQYNWIHDQVYLPKEERARRQMYCCAVAPCSPVTSITCTPVSATPSDRSSTMW